METTQGNLFDLQGPKETGIIKLCHAELNYLPAFFTKMESDRLMTTLLEEIEWKQDEISMYGKRINLPRLSAWYGENEKSYTYSGIKLEPKPWIGCLLDIKSRIELEANVKFSSVLLNRYRNGQDYVGWHSDSEKELGTNPVIGSVNFGATRKFQFRMASDKTEKFELDLKHGTLLIMQGQTQHYWQHQIPKTTTKIGERINLTFRVIN